jgi:hypothetical protein
MPNQGSYDLRHDVDRLQRKVDVFKNEFADSFFIEASVPTIIYKDDIFNPKSITFYSYKNNKGKIEIYKGTLKVLTSVDGNTYTLLKTSNDTNITINLSDTTIKFYKCELYNAENQLLDSQTIPSLTEGEGDSSPISLFLGNESQLIPCTSDERVQDTFSFTIPFYCYKGTKLYPCEYIPSSPNPFTELGFSYNLDKQCSSTDNGQITITAPKDNLLGGETGGVISLTFSVDGETINKQFNWAKSIKGENGYSAPDGYMHFAYANDDKGETDFSTENNTNRKYMGTYYDYVQETSQDPSRYTWSLIKGEDGKSPSTEEIVESINESGVDAKTLDGKSPINFLSSVIPTTYIYRDESDKTQNYIVIYELGNIVIVQFYKFSGNSSDYGNDDAHYFRLFPDDGKHEIPERLRPPVTVYTNDLNQGNGSSYGRLKITNTGVIAKGNSTTGQYNNTYGTFIYTINPRTSTVLSEAESTVKVGDYLSVTLKDSSDNLLTGRNVAFNINGKNYYRTTDNLGIAKISLRLGQGEYTILGVFNGDMTYAPCEKQYTVNVVKTTGLIQFSGGSYQNDGYTLEGDILTVQALNEHGYPLSNFELLINDITYRADENGEVKLTVKENGTFVCKFAESHNDQISNRATYSNTVKIIGKTTPVTTYTRVPLSLSAGGTNGKYKGYNNDSLNVARVQKRENNSSASTAITCTHNSNPAAYLRTTPAQIYFNVFKFPKPTKACTLTATVYCGEFGGITGGHMNFPKLQLKDVINNITYDEKITQGNFTSSNKNTYLPFTITHTFTPEQASAIESDNLALLVIPQESYLTTTASYNVSEFRIDYVEMKIQY